MMPSKEQWSKDFLQSPKFNAIVSEVKQLRNRIVINFDDVINSPVETSDTARYRMLSSGEIHLQPFYILDYITSMSNEKIYDVGCGCNFFKKFYNTIGIDPFDIHADIKEGFDDNFIEKYRLNFKNVISINAIHFCKLSELENRVTNYFDLVQPGGYAYLAINFARVLEYQIASTRLLEKTYLEGFVFEVKQMFEKILDNKAYDLILYENFVETIPDEPVNGNIRILIKRKK